jgi:isocitrate dehydrogenase (NAD+)
MLDASLVTFGLLARPDIPSLGGRNLPAHDASGSDRPRAHLRVQAKAYTSAVLRGESGLCRCTNVPSPPQPPHKEQVSVAYRVTFIPGDGTGPEIAEATKRVLDATGVDFDWDVQHAGIDIMKETGTPLPQSTIDSILANKVGIKGPITTPVGTGFRSVNVALRNICNLYACVRPCKYYEGVRTKYRDVDLVYIRENTEDLYAGIEFEADTPDNLRLLEFLKETHPDAHFGAHCGISIKPISVEASERIVRYAFEYARDNGRKKVTAVHKANIMKFTDGLFLQVAIDTAKNYPDIEFEERIVDNMCMQLVQKPELYDVIVLPNLFGDVLSDLGAGLVGGLGVAPGANIGTEAALFEPTHGSAPKYAGLNKVNPMAMMLSGVMMLNYIKETAAANLVESAIADIIREGKYVTYDMKPDRDDPTALGTAEVATAVIDRMKALGA